MHFTRAFLVYLEVQDYEELLELSKQAEEASLGIFNKEPSPSATRDIKWTVDNPERFLASVKGKPIHAVVEYVKDGAAFKLLCIPDMQVRGSKCM